MTIENRCQICGDPSDMVVSIKMPCGDTMQVRMCNDCFSFIFIQEDGE